MSQTMTAVRAGSQVSRVTITWSGAPADPGLRFWSARWKEAVAGAVAAEAAEVVVVMMRARVEPRRSPRIRRDTLGKGGFMMGEQWPGAAGSGENLPDHLALDVGEAAGDAVVFEGEAFVVETEEVEDGGVEVVERVDVLDRALAEVVGGSVTDARAGRRRR
jgi:hypothetical protein